MSELIPPRHPWRSLRRAGLLAAGVYLAVLGLLLCLEDRLLYRPAPVARIWRAPLPELGIEEVALTASDGTSISAWFLAPPGWRPEAGAVLLSHGTNGNVSTWQRLAGRWQKEMQRAVLAVFFGIGVGVAEFLPQQFEVVRLACDEQPIFRGVMHRRVGAQFFGRVVVRLDR